jgi:Trehalose receptor
VNKKKTKQAVNMNVTLTPLRIHLLPFNEFFYLGAVPAAMLLLGNVRMALANFNKSPSPAIRTPPKHTLSAVTSKNDVNFHQAVSGVFTVVQFLGIMPVTGTSQKDYRRVKFKWLTLRVAYTLLNLIIALLLLTVHLERAINTKLTVTKTSESRASVGVTKWIFL